jgi:hypothetical protein
MSRPVYIETIDVTTETITSLNIQVKPYQCLETNYSILNTDKNYLCDTDKTRRNYNTVILNPETDRILNIGNPISTPPELFDASSEDICVTELIEGSIVYLFYDERISNWQMSTSNAVGGNYSYFRDSNTTDALTFLCMVMEAFREPTSKVDDLSLTDLPFLKDFDKNYCYGFVLQHPQNEMVHRIEIPRMYIVSVCELHYGEKQNSIRYVPRAEFETFQFLCAHQGSLIYFPKTYTTLSTLEEYKKIFDDLQTPKETMGISISNTITGERCEVFNPNYKEAKEIRGNNFNLQFHYLCLLKLDKVSPFLRFFPHYRKSFFNYKEQLSRFITNLHQTYFKYYVEKSIKGPIHKKYYYHISQIHKTIYIPSVEKGQKTKIKRSVVASYVESMEPGQILHMINFEKNYKEPVTDSIPLQSV